MKKILISALVIISGCDLPKTKEGCTQYLSEAMQASTAACIAAYNEEIARAKGGVVTKCTRVGADLSCTTYQNLSPIHITQPFEVTEDYGEILKGTATESMSGSSFKASNGRITCAGTYDGTGPSYTASFPVICSDGRKGLGTATRYSTGITGSETIKMNDGSDWTFVFGPAANAF